VNILSLAAMRKAFRITMDSNQEAAMIGEGGLYYYAVKPNNQKFIDYTFA